MSVAYDYTNIFANFDRKPEPSETAAVSPIEPARASRYAGRALEDEEIRVRHAPQGTRNDTLNIAAFNLSQLAAAGHIDEQHVRDTLAQAAYAAGLEEREIVNTLNSGFRAGTQQPRQVTQQPENDPPAVTNLDNGEAADTFTRWVAVEAERERIRRAARRNVDNEETAATFRPPPYRHTLTDELAIPDEPITYTVNELMPTGANVLLTAAYKTGKTTLINNLAQSLADQQPFLGRFNVAPPDGRVALFNYEVDDRVYRRWLRDAGITNTDQVAVLNLRGFRLPVTTPHVEDWVVNWLTEQQVAVWIVDPFARAFTGCGTSENDNTEVGRFLDTLDVIKQRANVTDLVLPTHTGREHQEAGQERARGATRLDDWADARWILTADNDGHRYFRATGRDVDVAEEQLAFNDETRALSIGGWDRTTAQKRRLEDEVLSVIRAYPGSSQREISGYVNRHHATVKPALDGLIRAHKVEFREARKKGMAHVYYPAGVTPVE